jgi:hypothetical protein
MSKCLSLRVWVWVVTFAVALGGFGTEAPFAEEAFLVNAWYKDEEPQPYETRILSHLEDFVPGPAPRLSAYGGWLGGPRQDATGYFHAKQTDGRWWLVDPEGHPFLHVAMNSVSIQSGPQFKAAFPKKYSSDEDWAQQTCDLLRTHGFNGTGNWSDDALLRTAKPRLVYAYRLDFMGSFGRHLGVTYQVPGHLGYPNQLIPVFHPEFEPFCRTLAENLRETRDDPFLLGIFSDNEIQLPLASLDRHLELEPASDGRQAAEAWLAATEGGIARQDISDAHRRAWIAHVMDRYYRIVRDAIRSVDSNHLYLGSRLHGSDRSNEALLRVAGKYVDVIAVNIYRVWTPTEEVLRMASWSGKPILATEWYAKGQDSGMPNLTGAGWTVPTQADRGHFYQNFVLGLLESRGCVGWHYFKYADNDPLDTTADPSNIDANKGIVNMHYENYTPLLDAMKDLNTQVYPLATYFDQGAP